MDNHIHSERVDVERKRIFFDLNENHRGRFLRITEDVNGRRNVVVIPASGLEDCQQAFTNIVTENKKLSA